MKKTIDEIRKSLSRKEWNFLLSRSIKGLFRVYGELERDRWPFPSIQPDDLLLRMQRRWQLQTYIEYLLGCFHYATSNRGRTSLVRVEILCGLKCFQRLVPQVTSKSREEVLV